MVETKGTSKNSASAIAGWATSQSCACTRSGSQSRSVSPERTMACPMAIVQAIMSVPKVNSCGSWAAAMTRTPSVTSSVDGWVLGSVPVGRRESTTTSWPAITSSVARWCTWRPRPPMITGGYSHDTMRIFTCTHLRRTGSSGEPPGVQGAEQPVGAVPVAGQPLRLLAPPGGQRRRDLPGGMGVQMGAVAGVFGGGVLADHERPVTGHRQQGLAQDLVGHQIARRAGPAVGQRLVHRRQRGVDDLGVELHQIGHLLAVPDLPVLARTPRAGR